MDYPELWFNVILDGERVDGVSGFGAEARWIYERFELDVDGQSFQAERYTTEARTVKDLYVFNEATEEWTLLWSEDLQNL